MSNFTDVSETDTYLGQLVLSSRQNYDFIPITLEELLRQRSNLGPRWFYLITLLYQNCLITRHSTELHRLSCLEDSVQAILEYLPSVEEESNVEWPQLAKLYPNLDVETLEDLSANLIRVVRGLNMFWIQKRSYYRGLTPDVLQPKFPYWSEQHLVKLSDDSVKLEYNYIRDKTCPVFDDIVDGTEHLALCYRLQH